MTHLRTRQQYAALLVSDALALLIPFLLGIFWVIYYLNPDAAVVMLRPALFGAIISLALLHYQSPASRAERYLALVLFIFSGSLLVPSILATDTGRGLGDWVKQTLMCALALTLSRLMRDERTCRLMARSLIFCACFLTVFILLVWLQQMGLTLPTYKSSREFKGFIEKALPLNALSFASVFSWVLGMLVVRTSKLLLLLGLALVIVSSAFTGSRTPVAVLLLSGFIVLLFKWLKGASLLTRIPGWILLVTGPVCVVSLILSVPFKAISRVTEGRWDLWSVALQKFAEKPVFGYGYESWRDDLASRLPGEYDLTIQLAKNAAGGYHNEYLTMLAEQGLVGFLGAMTLFGFLAYCCWKLAFGRWYTWHKGAWPLFGCIFLFARAGVEMPGLFGYAQEPADYLALFLVAFAVSRFSIEEDYIRRQQFSLAQSVMPRAA